MWEREDRYRGAVKESQPAGPASVEALRDTLREASGRADLEFDGVPRSLAGGFYAEMLRFSLADPPPGLVGQLVARIVPNATAGEWEATIQRSVAEQGFPTPDVRLSVGPTSPLGRYLIVMDLVDGRPPLDGLGARIVLTRLPRMARDLPGQLARLAAQLHALDPEPLSDRLEALRSTVPSSTAGFVEEQTAAATALGRNDLAAAGERLLATEPASQAAVISHGDLHPFNLLLTDSGPTLIDWTVARVADPGFTVAFTELVLANPPVALPAAGSALLRPVARSLARRFMAEYHALTTGTPGAVGPESLDWHRKVHALRILVELAGWEGAGNGPGPGHPWYLMEPLARRLLLAE